jgi:hypothetical protein
MSNGRARFALAGAIVAVPLGAYAIAGLASGPRFPSRSDCARPVVAGRPVDLVFGRFVHPEGAARLAERAREVGFVQVRVVPDGCGRWEVAVTDYATLAAARGAQTEARSVGLPTRLEQPGP